MEWMTDPAGWVALLTLTVLEIVLGIDNIIFISIMAGRLPVNERAKARMIGLALAMITRVFLLFSLSLLMRLTEPWFTVFGHGLSGRDLVLVIGGMFLLYKSTHEIHHRVEGGDEEDTRSAGSTFGAVIAQIVVLDIVFSLDSVITAIGMANHLGIMITAVVIAVAFMMVASRPVGEFVEKHPTVKMLALAFLLMIGLTLVVDGFGVHVPKEYIYFAMAFSVFVEMLNLRAAKKRKRKKASAARVNEAG